MERGAFDPAKGEDLNEILAKTVPTEWSVTVCRGDLLEGSEKNHWLYRDADRVLALAYLCPEHVFVMETADGDRLREWLFGFRHDGDTGFTDAQMLDYASDRGFRYLAPADMTLVNVRASAAHERLRVRRPGWFPPDNFRVRLSGTKQSCLVRELPGGKA